MPQRAIEGRHSQIGRQQLQQWRSGCRGHGWEFYTGFATLPTRTNEMEYDATFPLRRETGKTLLLGRLRRHVPGLEHAPRIRPRLACHELEGSPQAEDTEPVLNVYIQQSGDSSSSPLSLFHSRQRDGRHGKRPLGTHHEEYRVNQHHTSGNGNAMKVRWKRFTFL